MTTEIIKTADPLIASLDNLLVVVFPKSTSQSYPIAVNIAQGCASYTEIDIGGKLVHFAVFGKTRAQAGRAQALLNYVSNWKGVQIFSGGKLVQTSWTITQVLTCYLEASGCNDWRAHCHTIIDDPCISVPYSSGLSLTIHITDKPPAPTLKEAIEIARYVFPCSHLKPYFNFQMNHPSTPEDQIQAAAVEKGCDWCPFFDPKQYKKVGVRIVGKDVFE